MKKEDVKLGDVYRDQVFGIEGVATALTEYLTGCARVCLSYVKEEEVKNHVVDVPLIVFVKVGEKFSEPAAEGKPKAKPGGPRPMLARPS